MTQSYKFSRLNPGGVMHNALISDRAWVIQEMKQGNIQETENGYLVIKPYGIQEFTNSTDAAAFIRENEKRHNVTVMHNEERSKKNQKFFKLSMRLVDGAKIGLYVNNNLTWGRITVNGTVIYKGRLQNAEEMFDDMTIDHDYA